MGLLLALPAEWPGEESKGQGLGQCLLLGSLAPGLVEPTVVCKSASWTEGGSVGTSVRGVPLISDLVGTGLDCGLCGSELSWLALLFLLLSA